MSLPDARGYFGRFGGRFVPEPLMEALYQLESQYQRIYPSSAFQEQLRSELRDFAGRPTPLYFADGLSKLYAREILLKREDLTHTGAHKINNCIGQALLAVAMGKRRIVAETGAGQHGVATAATCARLGMECVVYMGARDMQRQQLNVRRMQLFGAQVRAVHHGSATLKDAINEALRDWISNVEDTHYLLGSVVGPHPYPVMVRNFQKVIGEEVAAQLQSRGRLPAAVIACVGGGSNAIGAFHHFLGSSTELIGVEAGGMGEKNSATLTQGAPGVLHGAFTYILQRKDGQIRESTSIAPGLDYSAVGPEHSYLKEAGFVRYTTVSDEEAIEAFHLTCKTEGILPALESCHAIAYLKHLQCADGPVVVNLSGRGDKDLHIILENAH